VANANAGLRWLKRSDPNLARAQSNLDHIVKAGKQLNEVIDSTRSMFGKDSVERDMVDVRLLVSKILALAHGAGRERRLTIGSCLDQPGTLTMTVEDTGIGIDPAHIDRIFDPFFTTKAHGMGLGLSICRSIIEAHGGKLSVSARTPFGSSFCLSLPIFAASSPRQSSKS
jgi:signal transduction histidine kinase